MNYKKNVYKQDSEMNGNGNNNRINYITVILICVIVLLGVVGVVFCYKTFIGKDSNEKDNKTISQNEKVDVVLNVESAMLNVGDERTIGYTVDSTGEKDVPVMYTSSDNSIVSVTNDGIVKGESEGTAVITLSYQSEGKTITKNLTIKVEELTDEQKLSMSAYKPPTAPLQQNPQTGEIDYDIYSGKNLLVGEPTLWYGNEWCVNHPEDGRCRQFDDYCMSYPNAANCNYVNTAAGKKAVVNARISCVDACDNDSCRAKCLGYSPIKNSSVNTNEEIEVLKGTGGVTTAASQASALAGKNITQGFLDRNALRNFSNCVKTKSYDECIDVVEGKKKSDNNKPQATDKAKSVKNKDIRQEINEGASEAQNTEINEALATATPSATVTPKPSNPTPKSSENPTPSATPKQGEKNSGNPTPKLEQGEKNCTYC